MTVVPLSVLSNWETQIKDHVNPSAMKYCIYYGNARSMSATQLQKYDVVVSENLTLSIVQKVISASGHYLQCCGYGAWRVRVGTGR
jgi:SNF2 family DNA or RNA helicase